MQFTTVAIVLASIASASASIVARQDSPYPPCATQCIVAADLGGCQFTDTACLCKNQGFISSTTSCIEKSCTGSDLTNSIAVSQAACAAVGVPLSSSSSSTPSTSTAPTQSSGSPTSQTSPPPSNTPGAAFSNSANGLFSLAVAGLVVLAL